MAYLDHFHKYITEVKAPLLTNGITWYALFFFLISLTVKQEEATLQSH